jgi:hypothetical protein
MTRSKKTGNSRLKRDDQIAPYTEQRRTFFELTTAKRSVRMGGETKMLSNSELVDLKQLEAALAGSPIAQRDHQRRAEEAVLSREHHIKTECEMWSTYKELTQQAINRARARNEPLPQGLPHPADVLIDKAEGVTIVGPIDEEGRKRWEGQARFRDALFVQQIMEDADNGVAIDERLTTGAALVHGMLINTRLAPSLQLTDAEVVMRLFHLRRLSKREALVRCRKAWKAAGGRMPRGQHYGTLQKLVPMIEAEAKLCNALRCGPVAEPTLDALVEAFMRAIREFGASAPKRRPRKSPHVENEEILA